MAFLFLAKVSFIFFSVTFFDNADESIN